MPTVLVTDASRGSAIAFIRSLGRRGWRVVAADHHARSAGFASRYVDERVLLPGPGAAATEVAGALADAATAHGVDLLVPVTDDTLLPVSEARDQFPGRCRLAVPDQAALASVTSKRATLDLARRLGVPAPRTAVVTTTEEAVRASEDLRWPVVLKPEASLTYDAGGAASERFSVSYAGGPEELLRRMASLEGRTTVLLQELCHGEGHGVELLLHEGRPLAAFQHRRLHEVPITGGASALRESVALDPVLYGHAVDVLGALRWTGLAMVEFKVGPAGAFLMEVNGRIWGSLPLAVRAGMDFPARLAALLLDGPSPGPPDTGYEVGVRSRNMPLEVVWIGSVLRNVRRHPYLEAPRRRSAVAAAVRLPLPADGYDVLSWDDPRPGLAELRSIVTNLGRKVRDAAA